VVWISSNQTGSFGGLRFLGHAKVVDPEGRILRRTRVRAGVAVAEVDPMAMRMRARYPLVHLEERRPGAYAGTGTAEEALAPALA